MKSYAAVDRIEGKYVVCEVELVKAEESANLRASEKETKMVDILLENVVTSIGGVQESDILVVEQEEGEVTHIYGKDDKEKERRAEIIRKIMEKL